MQIKLFTYSRSRETIEAFEARVRTFVETAPTVTDIRLWEHNSDLIMQLTLTGEPRSGQDLALCIVNMDLDDLEELANNMLTAASRCGKAARSVAVYPLQKSPRAVLALVVEQERRNESNAIEREDAAGAEAPAHEPNTPADAGADAGTKRQQQRRDRKAAANRPA